MVPINYTLNFTQRVRCQTSILSKRYRIQPKLAFTVCGTHVDVSGLAAFIRIEMKAEWADTQNRWH
jgi:hypothetical protein